MGALLVLALVGVACAAAGILIGRYYVPDDRQLRRTARHARSYMKALTHLIARDHETVIDELRAVVEENVDDVEPYFALGALFRARGEHERAIRVHQALAVRERDQRKLRQRAMYELGLDFRAAGMPRRATRALEEVLLEEPGHEGALRALAALYEEQAWFDEAAGLWQRLGRRRGEDMGEREHHLLVAAAQTALARGDLDTARQRLKVARKHRESAHLLVAAAELAAARGNPRVARERLEQALLAAPELAPHVVPGLLAAERAIDDADAGAGRPPGYDDLADDDTPAPDAVANAPAVLAGHEAVPARTAGAESVAMASPALDVAPVRSPTSVAAGREPGRAPASSDARSAGAVARRVSSLLARIEERLGPRLEIALVRAQLAGGEDGQGSDPLAHELSSRFPDALASRVAAARLALAGHDEATVRQALEGLAGERGTLDWALRGRWACAHCGSRPVSFAWRCGQCRRWSTVRLETGTEPPPVSARERRSAPRGVRGETLDDGPPRGLLGSTPAQGLPPVSLEGGPGEGAPRGADEGGALLRRVGRWLSRARRRDA